MSSKFASQSPELLALIGREEITRRLSAFRLADLAAELPKLAFAAALI